MGLLDLDKPFAPLLKVIKYDDHFGGVHSSRDHSFFDVTQLKRSADTFPDLKDGIDQPHQLAAQLNGSAVEVGDSRLGARAFPVRHLGPALASAWLTITAHSKG